MSRTAIADADLQLVLASDYIHRGLSQTTHGPAYQGSTEFQFDSGLFLGIWASSADFRNTDEVNAEIDYFVGYQHRLTSDLAFDITAVRYTYPDIDLPRDYDWRELQITFYLGDQWSLSWGLAENWLGFSKKSRFFETSYRTPLPANFTVDICIGYQLTENLFEEDYGYAEVGISKPLGPLHARLAYSATDNHASDIFGTTAASRWLASLIWKI
ncbi:MAG: TorF family putative porin [Gammaproteobacteria bacterium]|nr:TorF family putative porin [Gammaproteobacteria bacterium]